MKMTDAVVRFLKDESGPTAVEYAVMLALIIVVCIAAIATLGSDASNTFDNVANTLGCPALDAALTSVTWKDRLLGANRMAEGPMYMTWFATGNNVAIAADTARRVCHVRLESPEEHPEKRQDFQHPNLLAWVGDNRSRLLAAALTILRA